MIKISDPEVTLGDIWAVVKALWRKDLSGRAKTVADFERAFADYIGVEHAVSVNSGTSALFIALKALGIGPGHEVIVPAFGYIAIPNAVTATGAKPVFVDVDRGTFNIDPRLIKITRRTKAIIGVHTYGILCDIGQLKAKGVPVIEDAAEALGGRAIKMAGALGDIGCFSLFANKDITGGEGGVITTNNHKLAREMRLLKDQYRDGKQYEHSKVGYSMALDSMSAALAHSQLKRLEEKIQKRNKSFGWICAHRFRQSFWLIPKDKRVLLWDVETRPAFYPLHWQKPYRTRQRFPNTEWIYKNFDIVAPHPKVVDRIKHYND